MSYQADTLRTFRPLQNSHNQSTASAFANASAIFSKIESQTQKVTLEIQENQRLTKDYQQQKKDLTKTIDTIKLEMQKVEKERLKIQEDIPRYSEFTELIHSKIVHKRNKSFESFRDITAIRQQVKQTENDQEQLKLKKLQHQQNINFEQIRIENLQKEILQLKQVVMQTQKEKEKLVKEIKKQSKIISNLKKRKDTMFDDNNKFYCAFDATTSKIINDGNIHRSKFLN